MKTRYLIKEEVIQYRHIRKWVFTYSDGTVEMLTVRMARSAVW